MNKKQQVGRGKQSGDDMWSIGDVRTVVVKKNKRRDSSDPITYAPSGKIVILENSTGRKLMPGDLVEIYLVEEKARKYYGRVENVVMKYAQIQKHARKQGEEVKERIEEMVEGTRIPPRMEEVIDDRHGELKEEMWGKMSELIDERLDQFKDEFGERFESKIDTAFSELELEELGRQDFNGEEEEEEEEEEVEFPVEREAVLHKARNSYVIFVKDQEVREIMGESGEGFEFEVFRDDDSPPVTMYGEPQVSGKTRVPSAISKTFEPLYEDDKTFDVKIIKSED